MQVLGDQRIKLDKEDSWAWKDKETVVFTVKSVYKVLKEVVQGVERELYGGFWRLKAQPSSQLIAWRVLEDKIATKAKLVRRGLCMTTITCCLCGEEEEITSHLFYTCRVSWLVWSKCYEWMGLAGIVHRKPKKYFESFRMSGVKESVNEIWGGVWIVVVGELWFHRNKRIFRGGRIYHIEIFTLTQIKAWSWVLSKMHGVSFSYLDWCLEPLICMRSINVSRR